MNTDKIFAEAFANEYAPKKASKVVALKKLDMKAKNPANIFAYTFGIIMCLLFGTGMCLGTPRPRRTDEADPGMAREQRYEHHCEYQKS